MLCNVDYYILLYILKKENQIIIIIIIIIIFIIIIIIIIIVVVVSYSFGIFVGDLLIRCHTVDYDAMMMMMVMMMMMMMMILLVLTRIQWCTKLLCISIINRKSIIIIITLITIRI